MVLPNSMRLKGYRCFDHLYRYGLKYHSNSMLLRVVTSREQLLSYQNKKIKSLSCKCAVAISNKVSKKAVVRNRLRRLLHSHLRDRLETRVQNSNLWALLSLKPSSIELEQDPLTKECDKLLKKAGLLQ